MMIFKRVNALAHLTIFLALYVIHICLPSMDSYFVPKFVSEAVSILEWKDAAKEEMLALEKNGTEGLALFSREENSWMSVGIHCEGESQ